jgi:hypothetical protein
MNTYSNHTAKNTTTTHLTVRIRSTVVIRPPVRPERPGVDTLDDKVSRFPIARMFQSPCHMPWEAGHAPASGAIASPGIARRRFRTLANRDPPLSIRTSS